MSKKKDCRDGPPKITRDEIDLFRNTLNNTKPIKSQKSQKNPPFRKKLTAKASFTKKDNQNVLTESLNVDIDLQEENNSDILRFHRSNITPKIMKKLSRGTFSVQSELDLHGMTSNEASLVLKLFISESVQDGLTCVRVIHGKGLGSGPRGPVIKQQVNRLLRRWDQVLAFISARQVDGGTGAVYVLLKKSQ
ncbi:MAG: DNA-nicking Smr family endonuclease [Woeseiaceae bacterium]|jgi:DNA-nicking Smr family endonuclease|tara:strand:+ start:58668 stop:59243 length:576 start_codon:yes stop_codon:yes gene_type:complete